MRKPEWGCEECGKPAQYKTTITDDVIHKSDVFYLCDSAHCWASLRTLEFEQILIEKL